MVKFLSLVTASALSTSLVRLSIFPLTSLMASKPMGRRRGGLGVVVKYSYTKSMPFSGSPETVKPLKSRRMMLVGRLGLVYEGCGGVKTTERIPPVLNAPNSRREIYVIGCQKNGLIVVGGDVP